MSPIGMSPREIAKDFLYKNVFFKKGERVFLMFSSANRDEKVFNKVLDNSNRKTKPLFVDNAKWLTKLNFIQFLRDIGSHFTINSRI